MSQNRVDQAGRCQSGGVAPEGRLDAPTAKAARPASPRLGRGLAALLGEAATPAPLRVLAVDALEPGPFQPRNAINAESLAELTESVRRQGILQPILARSAPGLVGRHQIIAGERRWRAAQAAGLAEIPVLLREMTDTEAMAASLVENLQRENLNPIEEAEGYLRLTQEFGLTQETLGGVIGRSRSHVANILRLLNLPAAVRTEVQNGALSAGHARALLAHPEPAKAALQVIARGLNVRQTEALTLPRSPAGRRRREEESEARTIEREVGGHLGLRVRIAFDGRGGSIRLDYCTLEQLDAIVALLKA